MATKRDQTSRMCMEGDYGSREAAANKAVLIVGSLIENAESMASTFMVLRPHKTTFAAGSIRRPMRITVILTAGLLMCYPAPIRIL